ncbi:hypothetical protein OSJ77_05745 [Phyllobacterium sp. 0TCS1.6C]|uniref:hypothetical protein n=1 Tax=unclassified Phyllobacterium TaxID=2638441 RepID=UPI002264AB4E|nr:MULTISPECIES: hypothetical protein [unclassified Phyllobacterium]MCX8279682.1 hypothetical protein [Phyllobacterium sp. 0TCS1.6C]MCX8292127.1 hypothetical protein [Phyllobacterium sp. 0TCS1.6A]
MSETPPKPEYPEHMEKPQSGLFEHYCMHPGCGKWGSFGFANKFGQQTWFCHEHKSDGNQTVR